MDYTEGKYIMKLWKLFLQRLYFLLLFAICIILWLVFYSLNAEDVSLQQKEVEIKVFHCHEYVHNLSKELAKQREQISSLLFKLDKLKQKQALLSAYETVKPSEVENETVKKPAENEAHQKMNIGAEIFKGLPLNNEFEIIPFVRFTANRLYLVEPGLGRRVIEKPIGFKKKDIIEVLEFAVKQLNDVSNSSTVVFTSADFLEGLYRTLPGLGTHYELYFKNVRSHIWSQYMKVVITRPFSEPSMIASEQIDVRYKLINLILPLSGRINSFRRFMDNFIKVCIHQDKNVHLTLVYFGRNGFEEIQSTVTNISTKFGFKQVQVILLEEAFSRSKGLQIGAQSWKGRGDVLLFMCDVDVVFNTDFLQRCRMNTESGYKVYYPIVFSLYNPKIVSAFLDEPVTSELVISKETGFWRDFGYGMTCQYHQDFLRIKGFDDLASGWGMEDVYLYRKYVRSDLLVVRASDPGIFHIWHEKYCDPKLSPDRYRSCIRSKALNEASHSQLGLLAFKDEIDIHQGLEKETKNRN